MRLRRLLSLLAGVGLAVPCFAADKDLEVSYLNLFLATSQPSNFAPVLIRCENKGANTKGTFTIANGSYQTAYPVDLPKGGHKEFIAYMPPSGYDATYGTLDTDIGRVRIKFPEFGNSGSALVSISDASGILNFTKSMETSRGNPMGYTFAPMSADPDRLPTRAVAYMNVAGVFLSDGAERMSEEAFQALERYLLLGGTVVVSGGAATPLFGDPKWRPMLPVLDPKPETMNPEVGEKAAGLELMGAFTMSIGKVAPGAIVKSSYRNRPFVVSKPYGLGRVVFVAVNAFENPVSQWPGKPDLIATLNLNDSMTKMAGLQGAAMISSGNQYGAGSSVYVYSGSSGYGRPYADAAKDPFSASPPPTSTVVLILLAYFVLVVPLNLLILRKMGKGEFAWITSPILSFGFAAIFFRFAAGLYSADLSTATTGVVVADQASSGSYFLGSSQMFFPRGGRYDLKLESVEGIMPRQDDPYMGMYGGSAARGLSDFAPIDTGRIQVKDLQVSNLSFKEFAFFEARKEIWLSAVSAGDGQVRITNRSGKNLKGALVYFEGGVANAGDFKPAESKVVQLKNSGQPERMDYVNVSLDDMVANLSRKGRVGVIANIEGLQPGPNVGKLVPNLTKLRLVWFGWAGGA